MDIAQIREKIIQLRHLLKANNIRGDLFILFGSYSAGIAQSNSDIDIAVVSRDFGKDRFREGSMLNYYASLIDHRFEAIPVGLDEYFDNNSISPILNEITTQGIPLL